MSDAQSLNHETPIAETRQPGKHAAIIPKRSGQQSDRRIDPLITSRDDGLTHNPNIDPCLTFDDAAERPTRK